MKIVQVGKLYPPHIGGVEQHMQDLALGLQQLNAGVQVEVLAGQDHAAAGRTQVQDGVLVQLAGTAAMIASTPITPGFAWHLARAQADCFHFHFPYPWGEVCAWLTRLRAPYVVTYHMDIWRQRMLLAPIQPILKRFLAGASRIITFSPQLAESSVWLRPHGNKIETIPPGFDLQRFQPTQRSRALAEELRASVARRQALVLAVGRLVEFKGLHYLIRAMKEVPAVLAIAGEGPERAALEQQVREIGVQSRVRFLGAISDEELPAWLQAADIFVSASHRPAEAFGLALAEAAASGLPLVSTQLPTGVQFVNIHGETGIVVPPGDAQALGSAIRQLISFPSLRAQFSAAARAHAQQYFDRRVMAERTLSIYHQVVHGIASQSIVRVARR